MRCVNLQGTQKTTFNKLYIQYTTSHTNKIVKIEKI